MAKFFIRDEIIYTGSETIQNGFDDFKVKLNKEDKKKHKEFKKAIKELLKDTDFERKNPPTYGFEEDTDPD